MMDNRTTHLSSPTDDYEISPKRQKLNPFRPWSPDRQKKQSPRISEWETACLRKEINAHRSRLSRTEVLRAKLRKVQQEIQEAFNDEEGILAIRTQLEKERIKELEERLDSISSQVNESQLPVAARIPLKRSEIPGKMAPLQLENVTCGKNGRFHSPAPPKSEKLMTKLDGKIIRKSDNSSQPDLIDLTGESDLEEPLKSASNTSSSLHDAVERKTCLEESISIPTKRFQVSGSPRSSKNIPENGEKLFPNADGKEGSTQMAQLQEKTPGTSPKVCDISNNMNGNITKPNQNLQSSFAENSNESVVASQLQHNGKNAGHSPQDRRVTIYGYELLVSHPKYFKIEWEKYYRTVASRKFTCTKCSEMRPTRHFIEDHIWTGHLGGSFRCPYCPESSEPLPTRVSIVQHMRLLHPDECPVKGTKTEEQERGRLAGTQQAPTKAGEDLVKSAEVLVPQKVMDTYSDKNTNQSPEDCRVPVGAHFMVVSDPKFFRIQWQDYYQKIGPQKFSCNKCTVVKSMEVTIQDHVWTQHCEGSFKCPYCPDDRKVFAGRSYFIKHMLSRHINVVIRVEHKDSLKSGKSSLLPRFREENKENEAESQNRRLKVGRNYVLVSHQKFFEIQWEQHYQKVSDHRYICNQCPVEKMAEKAMEDHLWIAHFGGAFECPLCRYYSNLYSDRYQASAHVMRIHS